MTANVHDLLSRRARKHKPALHFETDVDALTFARTQVAELERLAGSVLLLDAKQLDLPLSQLAAVLEACIDLCARPRREETR